MAAGKGFPKHMIDWIDTFGFRPENQGSAEADFFELIGRDVMPCYMVDLILGPQQFLNHYFLAVRSLSEREIGPIYSGHADEC